MEKKRAQITVKTGAYKTERESRSDICKTPLRESFKGKRIHGEKTFRVSEKERRTIRLLAILFGVMAVAAFSSAFLSIPLWSKVLSVFSACLLGAGSMGGYLFYVAYRHHKADPIEMHCYNVDYKRNCVTGTEYDNTKEIGKEEFFQTNERGSGSE